MALCTQTQVEQRLQIDFSNDEEPVISELIAAAQAHIEREAQRTIEAAARSEVFDPPDSTDIWLTHTPIDTTSTATPFAVTVDGSSLASNQYSVAPESGRLTRVVNGRPRSWRTHKVQSITVDYRGGYDPVPDDLSDICARAAARAFQAGVAAVDAPTGGVKQINLAGSDSVTFVDQVNDITTAPLLLDEEKEIARFYRHAFI